MIIRIIMKYLLISAVLSLQIQLHGLSVSVINLEYQQLAKLGYKKILHLIQQNYNYLFLMNKLDSITSIRKKINQYSYITGETIGKGYSSLVYKGINDTTDEEVAIKLIDMKNIKGDVHKTLLANEIEILKLLKNLQNIVEVYDIFNLKTYTCIVTELCNGGDLAKIIKNRKNIPEHEAIQILQQIINGYRNISKFGIVHRDLKPANIFFVNDTVKIADFGFAIKNVDLKKSTNYNVGSPVYMPLEALSDNIYSNKSDIWAIGVIFYEMLTGKTPWKAKTEADLKRQIKAIPIKNLIPTFVSNKSTDFLIRTLQVNQSLRMSPQELNTFFSTPTDSDMFYKNANSTTLRTNYLLRNRVMSQEKDQRPDMTAFGKNTVTAPKTYRKISFLNGLQDENPTQKLQNLTRTTATLGLNPENSIDPKKTSTYFISQIHFCRFFYKLIERIEALPQKRYQNLKNMMASIINGKLKELINLKNINSKYAPLFRKTRQFEKIQSVIEQYNIKYDRIFKWDLEDQYEYSLSSISDQLTKQILNLHRQITDKDSIEQSKEQIILLDYLITLKQLLVINSANDIEYFHNKSKIQAIVEGKPAQNITKAHLKAISDKLKNFKII